MVASGYTYYITLRRRSRGYEILYNIGGESSITTVLKLGGRNANEIFRNIIDALAKQGAVVPLKISDYEEVYSIRDDLGSVVGAYLILVRRARNAEKWSKFFRALLNGYYAGVARAFSSFLELAIELSRSMPRRSSSKRYALSPTAIDALSIALKRFVDKIVREMSSNATAEPLY